jgi:diguanylate cyclase (GGDEF)-like protein
MRNIKIFLFISIMLFAALSYKTYTQYQRIQYTQELLLLKESQSIASLISAFRQSYQEIFLKHNIDLDEKTMHLLPIKAMRDISKRFSAQVEGDITIRTVSDRPRNINNMANPFELKMMQYFKENPNQTQKLLKDKTSYIYTKPLYIQPSCLQCHGKREETIPSIRNNYTRAFDYKLGEMRGLLSIEVKKHDFFGILYENFMHTLVMTIILYLALLLIIYTLIQKIRSKEREYTQELEAKIALKTAEIEQQKKTLYYQAHHDGLTSLPNRTYLKKRLEIGIKRAQREQTKLALFFIDLDRFKQINDSLGHDIGDKVLMITAERLKAKIRENDTLARLGGDEFVIIQEQYKTLEDVSTLAKKILDVSTQPMHLDGQTLSLSCSIGISLYPKDAPTGKELLKYADTAMYKAKEEGRNTYQFYHTEMTASAFKKIMLKSDKNSKTPKGKK